MASLCPPAIIQVLKSVSNSCFKLGTREGEVFLSHLNPSSTKVVKTSLLGIAELASTKALFAMGFWKNL